MLHAERARGDVRKYYWQRLLIPACLIVLIVPAWGRQIEG